MIWIIFAGADDIGLGRRAVDADILKRVGKGLGQERFARLAQAAAPDVETDRRRRILRAGLHRRAGRGYDQQAVARDGEFACVSGARVAAEQCDGASGGEIDAAPLEPRAHATRAFTIRAQNLLQAARIAVAACAQNGRIDSAGGIGCHQFAALHAFHVDDPHLVAGVDRNGDDAPAGHGETLLARSKGKHAGPHDERGPRGPGPENLVASNNQRCAPPFV
jgi:hypothetical protein